MTTFKVYYMRPEAFRDGIIFATKGLTAPFTDTHVYLRDVEAVDLDDVYHQSQGEIWSPNGEAHDLIRAKGLSHTSMSMGDVIEDQYGKIWIVAMFGFRDINGKEAP